MFFKVNKKIPYEIILMYLSLFLLDLLSNKASIKTTTSPSDFFEFLILDKSVVLVFVILEFHNHLLILLAESFVLAFVLKI